ncbi:MAG: hypothetical protein ACRDUA_20200 [Micromonosporaceae bacterium]
MRATVLAGSGRAHELANLLQAVASPVGVARGWDITGMAGDIRVHVDPDGTVELDSTAGTAILRGALADPHRVAALIRMNTQHAAVVAERYRPTAAGRW